MIRVKIRTMALVATAAFALSTLAGCFKKVTNDTVFLIKPNLQTVSGGELTVASGVEACAWFNRSDEWSIASYDDAVARVLTDTENGSVETAEPDAQASVTDEGLLELPSKSASVLLLVLYPEHGMYAWRVFPTGENVSTTYLTVQLRTWKNEGYTDSGWTVGVVPREEPDQPEEPEEPEEPANPDDPDDPNDPDNPDNPDEPEEPQTPEDPENQPDYADED